MRNWSISILCIHYSWWFFAVITNSWWTIWIATLHTYIITCQIHIMSLIWNRLVYWCNQVFWPLGKKGALRIMSSIILQNYRPVQDTFRKYLDTDTFKILSEKSIRYRYLNRSAKFYFNLQDKKIIIRICHFWHENSNI